jgi:hypothetical protein
MKQVIYLLIFLIIPFFSIAQDKNVIKQQALIVAAATKVLDYNTIIKYTHSSLINMMGGRDAMFKTIENSMGKMSAQGISIDSAAIGNPETIYIAGEELHCLVPQTIIMTVPNGKLVSNSYLLAISQDKGMNWTFINVSSQLNNKTITRLLPNFNQELKIPEDTKPVFYKD